MMKKSFDEMFLHSHHKTLDFGVGADCREKQLIDNIKKKLKFNHMTEIVLKYKMILGCKCLRGVLFVEVLLEKIKLMKNIFMYDIELGHETFIPRDLS